MWQFYRQNLICIFQPYTVFIDRVRNIVAIHYREWLPPVTLATETGIAQLIIYFFAADTCIYNSTDSYLGCFGYLHSTQEVAAFNSSCLCTVGGFTGIVRTKNIGNGYLKMFGKSMITIITARHSH